MHEMGQSRGLRALILVLTWNAGRENCTLPGCIVNVEVKPRHIGLTELRVAFEMVERWVCIRQCGAVDAVHRCVDRRSATRKLYLRYNVVYHVILEP